MKLTILTGMICLLLSPLRAQNLFDGLREKGYAKLEEGEYLRAYEYLREAGNHLPPELNLGDRAIFFNDLGVASYRVGSYKAGINYHKKALEYYRKIGTDSLIAESLFNLALDYKEIGLFERAAEQLIESARIFEKDGSLKKLSGAWNALGNIHRELKNYDKALNYLLQALELRVQIKYEKGIADSYHNIGQIYLEQKRMEQAEKYLSEALMRKQKLKSRSNELSTLTLLGKLYLEKDQPHKAFSYLNKAYNLRLEAQNAPKIASSLFYLGNYYAQTGNRIKAYNVLRQCEQLALKSSDYSLASDALKIEIQLLLKEGNEHVLVQKYQALLEADKKAEIDEHRRQIAKLDIAYDVERKNNDLASLHKKALLDRAKIENERLKNMQLRVGLALIAIILFIIIFAWYRLRKNKRYIESQNLELAFQKQEISHLHRELSHRTKNYFGLLSAILHSDLKTAMHEETRWAIRRIKHRLDSMSKVQEYLSGPSRITNEVQLKNYLIDITEALTFGLNSDPEKIRTITHIEPVLLDYDKAMRLGIALSELVCNSVEHGFHNQQNPELEVHLKRDQDFLVMTVRDNGSGFPAGDPQITTNGLALIRSILSKIDGILEYTNDAGCVARVRISVN